GDGRGLLTGECHGSNITVSVHSRKRHGPAVAYRRPATTPKSATWRAPLNDPRPLFWGSQPERPFSGIPPHPPLSANSAVLRAGQKSRPSAWRAQQVPERPCYIATRPARNGDLLAARWR